MKKFKVRRGIAAIIGSMMFFIAIGVTIALWNTKFSGDSIVADNSYHAGDLDYGWFHYVVNAFMVGIDVLLCVTVVWDLANWGAYEEKDGPLSFLYKGYEESKPDSSEKSDANEKTNFPIMKYVKWTIAIVCCYCLFGFIKSTVIDCKNVYNKSALYHNSYIQKVQEKEGFYDKLWKTYLQKEKITNINKETFLQVTKIIMENRADGKEITWKWVKENQQIPYEQFTAFYADLSNFITSQREGYFNIEKECQTISNQNNTLLDTFPNNLYNKLLGCERINFEYGFTSDSTVTVFKTKRENLK